MYAGLFILAVVLMVAGCGKTVGQVTKIGHDLIDVGGKIYEDVVENAATVKDAVVSPAPSPGK